jgi:hypothetical protein
MTAKRIASYWVRNASPFLSILPGDLQTVFIDPQVRELEALGVEIRYDSDVNGGDARRRRRRRRSARRDRGVCRCVRPMHPL